MLFDGSAMPNSCSKRLSNQRPSTNRAQTLLSERPVPACPHCGARPARARLAHAGNHQRHPPAGGANSSAWRNCTLPREVRSIEEPATAENLGAPSELGLVRTRACQSTPHDCDLRGITRVTAGPASSWLAQARWSGCCAPRAVRRLWNGARDSRLHLTRPSSQSAGNPSPLR